MRFSARPRFHRLRPHCCTFFALTFLTLLSLSGVTYAQREPPSTVNILVADSQETPIFQADVRLLSFGQGNSPFRSFTDGAGRVTFSGVTRGSYYVQVTKPGYDPVQERVDVSPGTAESFAIRLSPKPDARGEGRAGVVDAATLAIPADARAELEKGQATLKDDPAQSIKHFREAVRKYPKYAEAYVMLGVAYSRNKQGEEALAALRKAIEINPKLALANLLLGKLYLEDKKFKEAESSLLESIRLDPQAWNGPYELARCYFNMNKLEDALTYARRAHDAQGAPSSTHLLLVDIYLRRGERKNALSELEEFSKADPQSPLMPRVRQMIEKLSKQN